MNKANSRPLGLFLDIQACQTEVQRRRGIPRYVTQQARALLKIPGTVRGIGLNPLLPFPVALDQEILASPALAWSTMSAFRQAAKDGPVAYHIMSPFELGAQSECLLPPYVARPEVKIVVTLYDLIPLLRPSHYLADHNMAQRYYGRLELIRSADLVLAISEHTRQDGILHLGLEPQRVVSVGAGVSPFFRERQTGEDPAGLLALHLPQISRPFVLAISGPEERKNTERLIQAYARLPRGLRAEIQLVIACQLTPHYNAKWLQCAEKSGLGEGEMVLTDSVSDLTLRALYQTAQLHVFASLYEGFGLPVAEAAACGCPTVSSNTSSLPEVVQFEEGTFDPTDVDDISRVMNRALNDQSFADQLRQAGRSAAPRHTWDSVAEKTVEALGRLETSPLSPIVVRQRPRIALAGPLPPARSGIADYNARLIQALASRCDVDVLSLQSRNGSSRRPPGVRYFPIESLGRTLNPGAYDSIIYTFGNSEHHFKTYLAATRYPGILWLHDVRLANFYLTYAEELLGEAELPGFMAKKVRQFYAERTPPSVLDGAPVVAHNYVELGLGMSSELVRAARAVIVNSHFARRLLELDQGPSAPLPTVDVIPLAVPTPPEEKPPARFDPPVILTSGLLSLVKAPGMLMDALALLRREFPVKLVFVGPIRLDFHPYLEGCAEAAGVRDAVVFSGDLSEQEYREYLRSASCAVQVRLTTNGESSAAVNDCLSAGLPVITNIETCREMPEGTVDLLEPDVNPAIIASRVAGLLGDSEAREALAAAGQAYARRASFDHAAESVLDLVSRLGSTRADFTSSAPVVGTSKPA